MKHLFFFIVAFLFSFCHAQSQTSFPPAYEIESDTADFQPLYDSCWQFLAIKNESWTIDQVSKPPVSDKFHFKNDKLPGSDTFLNSYWLRFRLKNKLSREARIALPTGAEYADFYISGKSLDKWKHYATGSMRTWDNKDGLKLATSIPVLLQPDEEITVYYFANNSKPRTVSSFRYSIRSYDKILNSYTSYIDNEKFYYTGRELTESFMIGFLFLAFFYTLTFFAIVKESVYLYFSLFVLCLCILRLNNTSSAYLSHESPSLVEYVEYLRYSWAFIHFFLIQFVRYFLRIFVTNRGWDKFLLELGLFNIFIYVLLFFSQLYFPKYFDIVYLVYIFLWRVIPLILLITLFAYTGKTDRLSRMVILGSFPMLFLYGVLSWFINEEDPEKSIFPVFAKWFAEYFRITEALSILFLVLSFSMILFIRYNKLRKDNAQQLLDNERLAKEKEMERSELIARQKVDLEKQVIERTAELKQSLEELKSTQSQLIQSEKMASLGELTAGIAHEIQNPLNFVNNFSEVNTELVDELQQELKEGKIDDAIVISNDIRHNEEKINYHGKRADAIVKGMLQHSRTSTGLKEPTDINALTDEYLRLAYHGLRAKDNSFNANMKIDFDNTIGNINIIPQDIGRVLLNLYTNAFYATSEKNKQSIKDYEPTVSVSTKKAGEKVEIKVSDNGNGIPHKVVDKIFQPFFTTKPTGQGTGLGLSLSYDIIKAYGGEIKVESKEGEGATFTIYLPVG